MAFPGTYFDGNSPERHSVLVTLTGEGLAIAQPDGVPLAFWRFAAIARSEGEGDRATTRLCRGEARLRIEGAEFARALRAVAPALAPPSRRRRLLRAAALVALTASVALSLYLLLPRLDAPLATLVPPSWEARLGARTIQLLGGRRCIDPAGEAALGRLVARLTAGVALPAPLHVEVSDRKEINAFTVPGGRVVLFDGLLKAAASADEVAGVLAHEITHSRLRHPTRLAIRQLGLEFFAELLLGANSGGVAETLVLLSYSRQFERQADAGAIALLTRAHIDTAPLAEFFARMEKERHGLHIPAILVTHPPPAERRAMIAAHPVAGPMPALSAEDWQRLKDICAVKE